MGFNSDIEWTTHTFKVSLPKLFAAFELPHVAYAFRFEVFKFVTGMAEGYTIVHIKAEIRVFSKRFDVMSAKVAAFFISAFLAGVIVTLEDGLSPIRVFWPSPIIESSLCMTVFVSIMLLGAWRPFSCYFADLSFGGITVRFAFARTRTTFPYSTHFELGFFGVSAAFECGNSTLPGFSHFYSAAVTTLGVKSIVTTLVRAELRCQSPLFALTTFFRSLIDECFVLVYRQTGFLCRNFNRTFYCLSHTRLDKKYRLIHIV